MKDTVILILLAVALLGWILLYNERGSQPEVVGRSSDTVWVSDTIRFGVPYPKLVKGEVDTVTEIDTAAVDSVRKAMGDSVAFYRHLVRTFQLQYEDSVQKLTVGIDPIRKTGLFQPFYKPIVFQSRTITNTNVVSAERWLQVNAGGGYRHRDSSRFYIYIDARIRLQQDLYLRPRVTTEGVLAELEYGIY